MPVADSKDRFSSRVADYVKYRPGYPPDAISAICLLARLQPGAAVADIGSGTGISAMPFLEAEYQVYGVEPNPEMRAAAEHYLQGFLNFESINGSAERTTLPDSTADLILCAQAFHWMDPTPAKAEFTRIARPGASIALVWNLRLIGGSPFLETYESLLNQYGTDYQGVKQANISPAEISAFLGQEVTTRSFANEQRFDLASLLGRVFSSSYTPLKSQAGHAELKQKLTELFNREQQNGEVVMTYETQVFVALVKK